MTKDWRPEEDDAWRDLAKAAGVNAKESAEVRAEAEKRAEAAAVNFIVQCLELKSTSKLCSEMRDNLQRDRPRL